MTGFESQIKQVFTEKGLTLATAESCTAGLLAGHITDVAGSSVYYLGGVVSYANEAKEALLGVKHETLVTYGAVSEQTAREMAQGIRERLGADLAISVTGIAGPGGGTEEKPVGLTYIGISDADGERAEQFTWSGDRAANRKETVRAALELILGWAERR